MRRLRYSVAMSLDGFIAGPQGEADWILMDPDLDFAALAAEFDTLLMGRKTFAPMARTAGKGKNNAGPFAHMKVVVVSSTLAQKDFPSVRVLSENLKESVQALKEEPGKDIWLFGGGGLFRTLLALALVDTVEVAVIPVLLGAGIPLLPGACRTSLRLASHGIYAKTGTVTLVYGVEQPKKRARMK